MTQKGYEIFVSRVEKSDGSIFYDTKLVKVRPHIDARCYAVPATETAIKHFGSSTAADIIMFGAVVVKTEIITVESVLKAIKEIVNPKAVSTNLEAFKLGIKTTRISELKGSVEEN